jgi:hypothetical protein
MVSKIESLIFANEIMLESNVRERARERMGDVMPGAVSRDHILTRDQVSIFRWSVPPPTRLLLNKIKSCSLL